MKLNKLTELISINNFIGYYETNKKIQGVEILDNLLPDKFIRGFRFEAVKGRGNIPALLSPSTGNAEAIIRDRGGFDGIAGELQLFKNSMVINEKDMLELVELFNSNNDNAVKVKVEEIYADISSLLKSAESTKKYTKARSLVDGSLDIKFDGGSLEVDYGYVLGENKFNHAIAQGQPGHIGSWDDVNHNIIDDITDLSTDLEERTGYQISKVLVNRKTAEIIGNNEDIRSYLKVIEDYKYDLGRFFRDSIDIDFVVVEDTVIVDGANKKLLEDGEVIMIASENKVGDFVIGTTPSQIAGEYDIAGLSSSVTGDGIGISQWATNDPISIKTKVEMLALPSINMVEQVISAKVF